MKTTKHIAANFRGSLCCVVFATTACTGDIGTPSGSTVGDDGSAGPSGLAVGPSPLSRLTRVEYERTTKAIFGDVVTAAVRFDRLPADGKSGRFESNSGLSLNIDSIDAYRMTAEDIGLQAANHVSELIPCGDTDLCVDDFIRDVGARLYRRPLSTAEQKVFKDFWIASRVEGTFADSMRMFVTAVLQTPDFLYRLEKGDVGDSSDVRLLTSYELASRLSFFFWKAGPDKELLDAAARGDLATTDGIDEQARRLLADPKSDYMLTQFHQAWLGLKELAHQQVEPEFAEAFEALKDDMLAETDQFVLHVFRNDDATVETLLTADYSFMSPELAKFYGAGITESGTAGRVSLAPDARKGILTQASFLTAHAPSSTRAAIYRGKSIFSDFLCNIMSLPDDVEPPNFDSSLPARQQIEQVTSEPGCNNCHSLFNPLGFAFEHYDAIGGWRDTDKSKPVDASGTVIGSDVNGPFVGAPALAEKLAGSTNLKRCISRQWLRYSLSRLDDPLDDASIEKASDQAQGNLLELLVALTQTDAFRYRRLVAPK